ncbi:MAG TPA: hypothetical protein VJR89_34565 [Polyangiales bacterium]|nr:hypothetical protein [Polyangiales bacterium]
MRRFGFRLVVLVALWCAPAARARDDAEEPPEPEATPAQDPGQPPAPSAPAPPPPPATPGDYAGTSTGESDADLSKDTAEEPDAVVRERQKREFSIRLDPLNWILLGRLGVELEMGLWKFLSVELIPMFVVADRPILLNYSRLDDTVVQVSRGIGPIAGASLGVGVWLMGEPFSGYVIRLNFSNYAYTYTAADSDGEFDRVEFTERRLSLFFGSHSRFGPFTFGGGFGLGLELHQSERCGLDVEDDDVDDFRLSARTDHCKGKQEIALNRDLTEQADLNGPLHPVYFEARFSIGVIF